LIRRRETMSQIGLTSHQRRENMRGAFAVTRADEVNGREILLVDDVYTTGTTAAECARILLRAGATQVWVATVARTLKLASNYLEKKGGERRLGADQKNFPRLDRTNIEETGRPPCHTERNTKMDHGVTIPPACLRRRERIATATGSRCTRPCSCSTHRMS